MKKNRIVLWTALGAAGTLWLGGCAGQSARMTVPEGAGASPVVRDIEDYREEQMERALRGLEVVDGRMVVNRGAAGGVGVGAFADSMARGDAELAQNNFANAVGAYRTALLADDGSAEAWAGVGRGLLGEKDDAKAMAAFRTAAALAPENTEIGVQYAETINANGDIEGWARELERVLAVDPGCGAAHARLAVAEYYLGDKDAARREIDLADRFGGRVAGALRAMLNK